MDNTENFVDLVHMNGIKILGDSFWKSETGLEPLKKKFEVFINNFREKNTNFDFKNGKFYYKDEYMRGLTREIDKKIGSVYTKKKLNPIFKGESLQYEKKLEETTNVFSDKHSEGCQSKLSCIDHGSLVDKQFYLYVHYGIESIKDIDVCTKRGIELINRLGWTPVLSQLAICDPKKKLATSVDMICISKKEKRFKFLEIKTSYSSIDSRYQYEKPLSSYGNSFSSKQNDDVDNIPHTAYIHNQIQMLISKEIFEKNYLKNVPTCDSAVISSHGEKNKKKRSPLLSFDYYVLRILKDGVVIYNEYPFSTKQKSFLIAKISKQKSIGRFKKKKKSATEKPNKQSTSKTSTRKANPPKKTMKHQKKLQKTPNQKKKILSDLKINNFRFSRNTYVCV